MRQEVDPTKKATSRQLLGLIESQGFRCALTGRDLAPDTASIDHALPVSKGGNSGIDNLMWVHRDVNSAKGTLSRDEFVALCKEVVAHAAQCATSEVA